MRYVDAATAASEPNIVVDGPANEGTVLTLSHWPGTLAPPGLARDLSAEMVFAYLDDPPDHPPVDVVTNDHFDEDGLVSIFAMTEPELARQHRELLIDIAGAGDFATFHERSSARAAMVLAARSTAETSCSYSEFTHQLYEELLPELLPIALGVERYRPWWDEEDAHLTASQGSIDDGVVSIDERPDIDLAIVDGVGSLDLHRMAVHNASDRFRVLTIDGRSYRYVDRYETWVQYQSRPTLPRIDLRPVADELTSLEPGSVSWSADAPDALTPTLRPDDESGLDAALVTDVVVRSLERSRHE